MENKDKLEMTSAQQEVIENFIRAGMDIERQRVVKKLEEINTKTISVSKLKKIIEE